MTIKSSISLTDDQTAFARAQEIEALRELVSRRLEGGFVSADEIDARVERMVADKRRSAAGRISEPQFDTSG